MEERDWLILHTLCEKKSITKTAQVLYISQPTLTGRLQQIEELFGVQIVIRSKRGVSFTPEGTYLVECARKMLHEMHGIKETLQAMKQEVAGTLRIAASNYFAKCKLPELLGQFRNMYPGIEFKVISDVSEKIPELIYNQEVDIGFVRGEHDWPYKKKFLFEENMCVISDKNILMEQLTEMPQIKYVGKKSMIDFMDNWWKGNFSQPPKIVMEVNRVESCKEMILKGLGYAVLPEGIVNDGEPFYKIKLVDKNGRPVVRRAWMYYHEDRLKIALVKAFIDYVNSLAFL